MHKPIPHNPGRGPCVGNHLSQAAKHRAPALQRTAQPGVAGVLGPGPPLRGTIDTAMTPATSPAAPPAPPPRPPLLPRYDFGPPDFLLGSCLRLGMPSVPPSASALLGEAELFRNPVTRLQLGQELRAPKLLLRDAKRRAGQDASTMRRVAALLRRFTGLAPGSVTVVSRSTGQPWKTARPLTWMGESVRTADPRGAHRPSTLPPSPCSRMWLLADKRGADKVAFRKEQATAVSEALARSFWRCFYTHTCGEWNLSFRNKCWKCSSKKGQAVEVVSSKDAR